MEEPTLRERKKQHTREVIETTALALFAEHGYEAVTITSVARAAMVGERTVYRYFADKEEMVFGGDDDLRAALLAAMASAPAGSAPTTVMRDAGIAVTTALADARDRLRRRAAVIATSPALYARERVKLAGYQELITGELVRRDVPVAQARLLAAVAVTCFSEGLTRWLTGDDEPGPSLREFVEGVFAEVLALGVGRSGRGPGAPSV